MTDFTKKPGAENRTVQDKMGADVTRALMTAPGKSLPEALRNYRAMTGKTIHDPWNSQCSCPSCWEERMSQAYGNLA